MVATGPRGCVAASGRRRGSGEAVPGSSAIQSPVCVGPLLYGSTLPQAGPGQRGHGRIQGGSRRRSPAPAGVARAWTGPQAPGKRRRGRSGPCDLQETGRSGERRQGEEELITGGGCDTLESEGR